MTVPGEADRMRTFPVSAIYQVPSGAMLIDIGALNDAIARTDPSPPYVFTPVPAYVEILLFVLILRITLFPASDTNRFP